MVDFGALRSRSSNEVAAAERDAQSRMFAQDDAQRDALSKKAVSITLVHEPEMRTLPNGQRVALLRGTEAGRTTPLVAVYAVPPRVDHDEQAEQRFNQTMTSLGGGDKVTLAGKWAQRGWNGQDGQRHTAWEFKAQHLARGEMPLERVLEVARAERGEAVPGRAAGIGAAAARNSGMGV